MTRFFRPILGGGLLLGLVLATQLTTSAAPPAEHPSAADAAKAATEQLKALPPSVVQVNCAPGKPTLEPFTTLSGVPGAAPRYILADGRCYVDPDNKGAPLDLEDALIP